MVKARNVMKSLRIKDFLQIDGKITGNGLMPKSKSDIWYVWEKKDSGNTGSGTSWDDAFLTFGEANTAAGDNDYIFVGPGSYDEGAAITLTQDYLTIIGTNSNNNMHEAYFYASSAVNDIMIVKDDKLRIYNMGFFQTNAAKACVIFGDTDGQAYYQNLFDGCKFDGGTYGLISGGTLGGAGNVSAPDLVVRNCKFESQKTASIVMNWDRAIVESNTIHVDAGNAGISMTQTVGNRPDQIIRNNDILGCDSTDTGIQIDNSPTAGTFKVIGNNICGCATSITTGKGGDEDFLYNQVSNATGGEIFDPSP